MTEFSVGDRVLVPGVVEHVTDGQRPGVRIPGLSGALLAIDPTHLRPDTGGRDLTVQDLGAAYKAWNDQHPGWGDVAARERFIPEYLNRIARGDAGSAGDDTAPPAEPDMTKHAAQDGPEPDDWITDDGQRIPYWTLTSDLLLRDAVNAWTEGIEIDGDLIDADGAVDAVEADARKVLAAIAWHRHYARSAAGTPTTDEAGH